MSISFRGTTAWTLKKINGTDPGYGLRGRLYTYRGPYTSLQSFLSSVPLGSTIDGGYITTRDWDDEGMYPEVRLTVSYAPSFTDYVAANALGLKTTQKSATVSTSVVIQGATEVTAEKNVSYYSPETRYRYFASSKPNGPRFGTVLSGNNIRIIRSVIIARATVDDGGKGRTVERRFGAGSAPAPLVSALNTPQVHVVAHSAEEIPHTPWWECEDVVARELQGDA